MIRREERIYLEKFYIRLYEFFIDNFSRGRININRMYKKTNPYKKNPYWLCVPFYKLHVFNSTLIVKFNTDQLGVEFIVDSQYFDGLKRFFSEVPSFKKFSKQINKYHCQFEENESSIFIYIPIPHIDIYNELPKQKEELTFIANALFDFCVLFRHHFNEINDLIGH